jgi:DedD protein
VDGLKQRIIGALVLVSLAVIFVPMIFDEPHSQRQSTPITIPEEPPFPEVDMPDSQYPDNEPIGVEAPSSSSPTTTEEPAAGFRIIEDDSVAEGAPAPEVISEQVEPQASAESPAQPEPAGPTSQQEAASTTNTESDDKAEFTGSLEGAWVVQLGSFGNQDNARRLRDKVLDMGYGAHLQQVERGDSTLTRVFSGPFVNKDDAQTAKAALDKAFGLNSLVTTGDK